MYASALAGVLLAFPLMSCASRTAPDVAGPEQAAAALSLEDSFEDAVSRYEATKNVELLDDFVVHHPGTEQAQEAEEMAGRHRLSDARACEDDARLEALMDVVDLYEQTVAARTARAEIEAMIMAKVLDPPNVERMTLMLRGPLFRGDISLPWRFIDESDKADEHFAMVRGVLVATLGVDGCRRHREACKEYVDRWDADPATPRLRALVNHTVAPSDIDPQAVKAYTHCTRGCVRRCAADADDACYSECMEPCNAAREQAEIDAAP